MKSPDLVSAAARLANLGFLANSDQPHRSGGEGAFLMVALRLAPSLHHYDPERIEYWVTAGGLGHAERLTRDSRLPCQVNVSWGPVRVVDRLGIANEYLTFGGELLVDAIGDAVIALVTSAAPLFKRGGHSQQWDVGASSVGAFFGRLLLAVDVLPGFEQQLAEATPLARYAAFIADESGRYEASLALREAAPDLWGWLAAERRWLRSTSPADWAAGDQLRPAATTAASAGSSLARSPLGPRRSTG